MAKDRQTLINENISSIKELREEIKRLKDSLVTAVEGSQEWNDNVEALNAAQTRLDKINKAAKGTLDQYNNSQKNSINLLKSRIKELNIERNAMDMNSDEYKKATKELQELNNKLRESGTDAGDWRANVGNYANSLSGAFGQLGSAATGLASPLSTVNAGMTKIAMNPIGMVVVALTAAIGALVAGIKSSEENTNRWNAVLAPLKGLLDVMLKAIQELSGKFLDFAEGVRESGKAAQVLHGIVQSLITAFNILKEGADKVKGVLSSVFGPVVEKSKDLAGKIGEKLQPALDKLMDTKVGQYFKTEWEEAGEATDTFINKVNEATEVVSKLDNARAKYAANERVRSIANAKDDGVLGSLRTEIALMREAISETEDYNEKRQLYADIEAKINEEEKIAQQIAQRKIASAQEALKIAQLESANTDNTAEGNNKLAAANVALIQAQNELNNVTREYANQRRDINKQESAVNEAEKRQQIAQATKDLTAALKELDAEYSVAKDNIGTVVAPESFEATKEALNEYYDEVMSKYEAEYEAYAAMTDGKIAKLEEFIEAQKALGEDTSAQEAEIALLRANQAKEYSKLQDNLNKTDKARTKALESNYKQQMQAYGNLLGAMQGMFEENTVAYKSIAVAKAIMDTYLGAQNALASLPPPASYAAAAATIATGIANVVQILKTDPKGENSAPSESAVATPNLIDSQPWSYTREVQTEAEVESEINKPIWVSVEDINNAQTKVKVVDNERTF